MSFESQPASDRRFRRPLAFLVAVLLVGAASSGPSVLAQAGDQPGGCVEPNRRMTLFAEQLPSSGDRLRLGWGLSPGTATSPGPVIEMTEGDCLAITVVNRVPRSTLESLRTDPTTPIGVSLHVHGVKYRPSSDGTAEADSFVPPGQSRTYVWYAAPRVVTAGRITSIGTAGTWWYHDHVVGTRHGTAGVSAGLVGGLVVRRAQDLPRPDRTFTVVMGPGHEINFGRGAYEAVEGERVEFIVIGVGDNFHTFHLHGHNWADTRTGLADTTGDVRLIDAKTVGPSESFGLQIRAGESVGHGDWMLHCHVQGHSDQGMSTMFIVHPAGTVLPAGTVPSVSTHEH